MEGKLTDAMKWAQGEDSIDPVESGDDGRSKSDSERAGADAAEWVQNESKCPIQWEKRKVTDAVTLVQSGSTDRAQTVQNELADGWIRNTLKRGDGSGDSR